MSNDLISKKPLLKNIDEVIKQYSYERDGAVLMDVLTCVRDIIFDIPTVYDTDKVVEELETTFDKWGLDDAKKSIMREIVKEGGTK